MKKLLFLISILVYLFSSCKKDSEVPTINKYGYIVAGDSISKGVVHVNIQDVTLESDCSREYFTSCGTAEKYKLDLNQDDSIDYEIELFYMMESGYGEMPGFMDASISIVPMKMENKISLENDRFKPAKGHSKNDTINNNLLWTEDVNLHYLIYTYITGYENEKPDSYGYYVDSWKGQFNKYIGLYMTLYSDTIYGWVRVDVYDEYKIVIKDFAYRK